uniref:Sim21 n=1 Tax=Streptomyces antibioticus TaxID=1890 RepID=Q93F98_STRAT|nr:Sim21 [Streptomyces antibioticus]
MSTRVRLREGRMITSDTAPGTVVRCDSSETMYLARYVSVAFFFERTLDTLRLADGLRGALALVPAFAGRLRAGDGGLEIVCSDAGVPLSVLDVDATLDEARTDVTRPDSMLIDRVDVRTGSLAERPLLTVRVCRTTDGGATLGCSWNHAVGDMSSFMQFVRAWAALVGGTAPPEIRVLDDRMAYLDQVLPDEGIAQPGCEPLDRDAMAGRGPELPPALPDNAAVQLYFGADEVLRMRKSFGEAASRRVSVNDAICAHLVATLRDSEAEPTSWNLSVSVDLRHHLGLPRSVIGNLVQSLYVPCPQTGAGELSGHIRAGLDDFIRSHQCLRADRAFIGPVGRSRFHHCAPVPFDPGHRTFILTNWTRMGVYDVEFEGQRPTFFSPIVSSHAPFTWFAMVAEGPWNEGFLVTAVLPAKAAEQLRSPEGRAALHRFAATDDPCSWGPHRQVTHG